MSTTKVLIPVDGTQFSEAIFDKLALLADPSKTEIVLLYVSELVAQPVQVYPGHVNAGFSPTVAEGNMRHIIMKEMEGEAQILQGMGYKVSREVGFGDPVQQILFFADLAEADLIAMATHGRDGLSRLLSGSVAESVLHAAKVPVLMVRPSTAVNA